MTKKELNDLEKRAFEIKEEIQIAINKKQYSKMVKLSKEFKKIFKKVKNSQKEINYNDKN